MRILSKGAAILLLSMGVVLPAVAVAGEGKMERNGVKVSLECSNDGCYVIQLTDAGTPDPLGSLQRLGEGGSKNYKKWRRAMIKQGWKPN